MRCGDDPGSVVGWLPSLRRGAAGCREAEHGPEPPGSPRSHQRLVGVVHTQTSPQLWQPPWRSGSAPGCGGSGQASSLQHRHGVLQPVDAHLSPDPHLKVHAHQVEGGVHHPTEDFVLVLGDGRVRSRSPSRPTRSSCAGRRARRTARWSRGRPRSTSSSRRSQPSRGPCRCRRSTSRLPDRLWFCCHKLLALTSRAARARTALRGSTRWS